MGLFNKTGRYKILFVASEAAPFVKVGGLGEVMHSLPKAMRGLGYDARVMTPKYATIDIEKYPLHLEYEGLELEPEIRDPNGLSKSNVLRHENEEDDAVAYFLENMEYYEKRANVYGYGDDTARWVLLSRGILEFIKVSDWKPDIIVAADWQTGFIPNLIHTEYKDDPVISKIPVAFSIHNLKWQGMFDPRFVSEMDFDSGQTVIPSIFNPQIFKLNGMRRGIMYADVINTVSPTYAKEILVKELGEGLDKLLNERKDRLFGILNGVDHESLNPETDDSLAVNYSVNEIEKKLDNKEALQKRFGLPQDKEKFVIGMVTRISEQKGLDLLVTNFESLLSNLDFQFVIVGEGEPQYRLFLEEMAKKYPDRVAGHFNFESQLPRMIFAGADVVLIPSRFEPSGLVQMEAMRYGCIPIVRKVGGLADSVDDFDPRNDKGTGFVFEKYDPFSLAIVIVRALEAYKQKREWRKLIKRAMSKDFSWEKSAKEYVKIFDLAIKLHKAK
ncbi:MAG: hypothetical protein A2750_02225 [Candidatus Yanofskybacteria bacterium RIFCSPHIGHO2_01_FULL_45_42]|uniref:Glycogen synthase n=2 Tax=Candidatus Yanofskyibacteriota TaxID=1752733 RepID=A0A1F8FII2_9BACT|nr:MAG: hypothetical protein A2750_02225 [Candidatus Yanofskybacteria bacterium RIFCSPHIGHO2_01_FULL_45_42]OGN12881.1 MAG: hypothetical protein A3J47_00015 [Candidatus Yanofskybacteria bacterium RIFCSPHIGHO2_02_FULL_43_22]